MKLMIHDTKRSLTLRSTEETKLAFRTGFCPWRKAFSQFQFSQQPKDTFCHRRWLSPGAGPVQKICFHFYILELCSFPAIISWWRYCHLGNATLLFVCDVPTCCINLKQSYSCAWWFCG